MLSNACRYYCQKTITANVQTTRNNHKIECIQCQKEIATLRQKNDLLAQRIADITMKFKEVQLENNRLSLMLNYSTNIDSNKKINITDNEVEQKRISDELQKQQQMLKEKDIQIQQLLDQMKSNEKVHQAEIHELNTTTQRDLSQKQDQIEVLSDIVEQYSVKRTIEEKQTNDLNAFLNQTRPDDTAYNMIRSRTSNVRRAKYSNQSYQSYICQDVYQFGSYENIAFDDLFEQQDEHKAYNKFDQMEKMYDLYENMNNYLHEMSKCVQIIETVKKLKQIKHSRKTATSIGDNDSGTDSSEEPLIPVLRAYDENHDEKQQLNKMKGVIEESRGCIEAMFNQMLVMMSAEEKQYEHLETVYKFYQHRTEQKIKQLTKDTYSINYRKYSGYSEILWDTMKKVNGYTKDVIVDKLTH